MAAAINFYAGSGFSIQNLGGSGLGFYGNSGFGASVPVGQWQGHTFITDATGTVQGQEVANCEYLNPTGTILGQTSSGLPLNKIPNYQATVNIRFTNNTAVRTQNGNLSIYDRSNPSNPAVGVTSAIYEVAHPDTLQNANGSGGPGTPTISGAHAWYVFPGGTPTSGMPITSSPGTSGLRPSGSSTIDTRHDFYIAISASPDSIGSKTQYGLYISLEYL